MKSEVFVSHHHEIDQVSPLIYGGFLEHMGRCIYEGIYAPKNPLANDQGLRKDVIKALSELHLTNVRYPGGNFVSGYHWMDGVGPLEKRPVIQDRAWKSLEPNLFGTDEFIHLCRELNWKPMLAVNLGTGSPEEAADWVEYCNASPGTKFSDLRVTNGYTEPHAVPMWCLGNEMDGNWQLGHTPAAEYAVAAQQAAHIMRRVDPSISLIASGSSGPTTATFLDWDRTILEKLGDLADYVSLHRYVGNHDDDTASFLGVSNSIDKQIEDVDAVCRYAAAKNRRKKRPYLCFDEWNVWYKTFKPGEMNGSGKFAQPIIEEEYNLEDALVVASFLMSFIRHADIVKIANLAQLVNVIAPLLTSRDDILKQSTFYAFKMLSSREGGVSLRTKVASPQYNTELYGSVNYLDQAVTLDENTLNLFLINRALDKPLEVKVTTDLLIEQAINCEILHHENPKAKNTFENREVVVNKGFDDITLRGKSAIFSIPPLSLIGCTLAVQK